MTDRPGEGVATGEFRKLTDAELAARRKRSLMTALALFAFVILVFAITVSRLGDTADAVIESRSMEAGDARRLIEGTLESDDSSLPEPTSEAAPQEAVQQ